MLPKMTTGLAVLFFAMTPSGQLVGQESNQQKRVKRAPVDCSEDAAAKIGGEVKIGPVKLSGQIGGSASQTTTKDSKGRTTTSTTRQANGVCNTDGAQRVEQKKG